MTDDYHWRSSTSYIQEIHQRAVHLALYRGKERLGTLSVERDKKGNINKGLVLNFDGNHINFIDFFDKLQSAPGLTSTDAHHAYRLRDGFFLIEGYVPGRNSRTFYGYQPDPQKRQRILERLHYFKREIVRGRIEGFIQGAVDEILEKRAEEEDD